MKESLHLGTIGRTRIGLNWSVVVVAAIIAFSLATGVLPDVAPGFRPAGYWSVALVASFVFFASLLAHELSHALVARRRGVPVEGIVLWALGGVAKLGGDAPDATSELRIGIVGPIASLVLGGVFALVALGFGALGASRLVLGALWWLAEINVLLGLFNLLPAYPLDGGRVLRAGLWRHSRDRMQATTQAARVGGIVGTGMIALGLFATFFLPAFPLNGLWLALIGWFVLGASRQEVRSVGLSAALDGLSAGDAMRPIVAAAPSYAYLDDVVEHYLRPGQIESIPLVEFSGALSGLLEAQQVSQVPQPSWSATRASQIAWSLADLVHAEADEPLLQLVRRLAMSPSRSALVFDHGRLVGIATSFDVERVSRSPHVFRAPRPVAA